MEISLSHRGDYAVRAVLDLAAQSGITVKSLSVQSTTLDDVFVHYAGRDLRDAPWQSASDL